MSKYYEAGCGCTGSWGIGGKGITHFCPTHAVESMAPTTLPPGGSIQMTPVVAQKSWLPTKKWAVTQITAVAALLTMWVTTGSWDAEESIALIGLLSQAAAAYFVSNADTPGGVPVADGD